MVVLVNPRADAGNGIKKWNRVATVLAGRYPPLAAHIVNGRKTTEAVLSDALRRGETDFVAAGGDGSVNTLLNLLLEITPRESLHRIRIGAVGIGSSNDFHKPAVIGAMVDGVSCRLDFARANPHDVGIVSYLDGKTLLSKYFIVNASIGITAQANCLFNNRDRFLAVLHRISTSSAIAYSALRSISCYVDRIMTIQCAEKGTIRANLTNLAVLKNPHVSGSLKYTSSVRPDDGEFEVSLCREMSRGELLRLLSALTRGRTARIPKLETWRTASLMASAESPYAVEFDGEVVRTTFAQFTVLPRHIKVCQC